MINISYFEVELPDNLYYFQIGQESYQVEPPATWLDPWIVRPCTFDEWKVFRYTSFSRIVQFIKKKLRSYDSPYDLDCKFYFPLDKQLFLQSLRDVPHLKEVF